MKKTFTTIVGLSTLLSINTFGQNVLPIPAVVEGSSITLTLDEGVTEFYPGVETNTMGANGALLGPTLILNQGDDVSIEVVNQLEDTTTIHWHGLHVAPSHDGGPHSIILPGTSWNPQFTVLDKAGTYWYHPHLHMRTAEHVTRGIAGFILVRDDEEAGLGLPLNYGVDEFPIAIQTRAFDADGQLVVETNLDTAVVVNGVVDPHIDMPAQVVRLRLLNGATQRVMELGFSDDRTFHVIGTDGGLLSAPVALDRYRLAPGQRVDVLVDLGADEGQDVQLMCYGSELPNAYYGAAQPGMGAGQTSSLTGYTLNPLNGGDFNVLEIHVVAATANPITNIPESLASLTPIAESEADQTRNLTFSSASSMMNLNGPFLINGASFDMETINYNIPLNHTEIWSLTNQTPIAHPFHIHDVQFYILDINGATPPPALQGLNDVVLVPGMMGNVRFIAQFSDHADPNVPYMYHCHMLYHEDGGMMGQFLVTDPNNVSEFEQSIAGHWSFFPNPTTGELTIRTEFPDKFTVFNLQGQEVISFLVDGTYSTELHLEAGVYMLSDSSGRSSRLVVQ
ncbi:MAG: multicopper oxidase domain-containing protein [Flavobacteriales bacterium]|nr:multicopper oxidase domain-containing protein [Flavobacteriales bacterium]